MIYNAIITYYKSHGGLMKKGFTLAEVLITLGIIGVVAAMTIPTLIANYQEKQTVTRVKAAYTLLNNAVMMAVNENGPVNTWLSGTRIDDGAENYRKFSPMMFNKILPHLKTIFTCSDSITCRKYSYKIQNLPGTAPVDMYMMEYTGAKLLNGTYISVSSTGSCEQQYEIQDACGTLYIDVNGPNPPNQKGRDVFLFIINNQGYVLPRKFDSRRCNLSDSIYVNGNACTEWVILKGNLNYLKCDGLSLTGKDTCD